MKFALFIGATLSLISVPSFADHGSRVEQVQYHGWAAYRLSNKSVELIFVPKLGRIMRFAEIGSENLLWENPALAGKEPIPPTESKDWQNYGGDKTWPAPQEIWNWPPDPTIDPGSHTVAVKGDHLLVTGGVSAKHNIRFQREIWLDKSAPVAIMRNTMTNTAKEMQKWSVWQITQVKEPDWTAIPSNPGGGYVKMMEGEASPGVLAETKNGVLVRRDKLKPGKIGSTATDRVVASKFGKSTFHSRVLPGKDDKGDFPDKGCRQEIYWNNDPLPYVEMELLGPILPIKPGKSIEMVVEWRITK